MAGYLKKFCTTEWELKKENISPFEAWFLELNIKISDEKFSLGL